MEKLKLKGTLMHRYFKHVYQKGTRQNSAIEID